MKLKFKVSRCGTDNYTRSFFLTEINGEQVDHIIEFAWDTKRNVPYLSSYDDEGLVNTFIRDHDSWEMEYDNGKIKVLKEPKIEPNSNKEKAPKVIKKAKSHRRKK